MSNPQLTIGEGANVYQAIFKGKRVLVNSNTSYGAQQEAQQYFRAKKGYDITIMLIAIHGVQVVHTTDI